MTGLGDRVDDSAPSTAAVTADVFLFFFLGAGSGLSRKSRAGLLTLDRLSAIAKPPFRLDAPPSEP